MTCRHTTGPSTNQRGVSLVLISWPGPVCTSGSWTSQFWFFDVCKNRCLDRTEALVYDSGPCSCLQHDEAVVMGLPPDCFFAGPSLMSHRFVTVRRGSPAARCGQIQPGDQLEEVEGRPVSGLHHRDLAQILRRAGNTLRLSVTPRQRTSELEHSWVSGPDRRPEQPTLFVCLLRRCPPLREDGV